MFINRNFVNWYRTIIFIIMAILTIVFIGKITDVAIMFFGAFIISASVLPIINKLKNYIPRGLAVSIVLLSVFAGILLIFIPLFMFTLNQAAELIRNFPSQFDKIYVLINKEFFGHSIAEFINQNGFENLTDTVSSIAGGILDKGLTAGKVIASSITSILMVSIMVFYLCMDENHMEKVYLTFFPPKFKKKADEILQTLKTRLGGYVLAQLLTMAGVGIITFLGLLIVHHPHPTIIGFLTFVLDFIPVIGPLFAVLLGLITSYDGGVGFMVLVLVIMGAAQWAENQILRPYLFGKFMNIHPLLIIVSLLIGAKFLGFIGMILGPAFAGLICILVDELYVKQINGGK